jgi:phospholipid-binding lipoprotein MlaA
MTMTRPHSPAVLLLAVLLAAGTAHAETITGPSVETPGPAGDASTDATTASSLTGEPTTAEPAAAPTVTDPAMTDPPVVDAATTTATDTATDDAIATGTEAATTGTDAAPTDAELEFAAIYGNGEYDPVADATLPAPATLPITYDPWEKLNRKVHRLNNVVDRSVAKPLAKAYVKVVPRPVRLGVSNFFHNLGQPVSAVNALLQGKPKQAGQSVGRFLLNATLGVGGLFDPATDAKIPDRSEDFGQTLGVWGWKKSRYVELPLFGPRTLRDAFGMIGDAPLSPIRPIELDKARVFLQGLQLVDVRTQLLSVDSMREGAADDYALVRDAWMQRRQYQIEGDRPGKDQDSEALPDYLQTDDNPTVPADAMPIIPGSP